MIKSAALAFAWNLLTAGHLINQHAYELCTIDVLRELLLAHQGNAAINCPDHVFRRRLRALLTRHRRQPVHPPEAGGGPRNVRQICDVLGLDSTARAILLFVATCSSSEEMDDLLNPIRTVARAASCRVIAAATNCPEVRIEAALRGSSKLISSGLLRWEPTGHNLAHRLTMDPRLLDLLGRPALSPAEIPGAFIPICADPTLGPVDFPHLAKPFDIAARLLMATLAARRQGMNILLHGPTGTGKTEFAGVLANAAQATLHIAGKDDGAGSSPSARQRLTSLTLGNHILGGTRSLLLFDELEDLLGERSRWMWHEEGQEGIRASKQWFNQTLENNAVPTIWITNDISGVDPAFLRRFSYAAEVRPPSAAQRRRVWDRHLGAATSVATSDIDDLAERFPVSPAQIGTAVAAARLLDADAPARATLEALLEPAQVLTAGRRAPARPFRIGEYDPSAVNTPVDLEAIVARLVGWSPSDRPGVSLCLYGPPGTGKSEFVRYLAHRMDRPLVARRVSDIVSMWLGETERNIAEAFRAAAAENAVLLFDEADSFLRDRRSAERSWEVTQVNEFLQQLEDFRGIVVCTTNLFRDLDQASLRRFTFKIPFDYLHGTQVIGLLRRTLGALGGRPISDSEEVAMARETAVLATATPGDFAAVARRLSALGERPDAGRVLAELRAELAGKEVTGRRAGFAR